MPVEYIDRPPRIQPELPIREVPIPAPPEEQRAGGQSIATALIPMITIVGFMLVSGSGNLALMLPHGTDHGPERGALDGRRARGEEETGGQEEGLRRKAGRDAPGDDPGPQRPAAVLPPQLSRTCRPFSRSPSAPRTAASAPACGSGAPATATSGRCAWASAAGRPRCLQVGPGRQPAGRSPLAKDAKKLDGGFAHPDRVPITVPLRPYETAAGRGRRASRGGWSRAQGHGGPALGRHLRQEPHQHRRLRPGHAGPFRGLSLGGGHAAVHRRPSARPGRLAVGGMAAALQRARHRRRRGSGRQAKQLDQLCFSNREGKGRRILEADQDASWTSASCACARPRTTTRRARERHHPALHAGGGGPAGRDARRTRR